MNASRSFFSSRRVAMAALLVLAAASLSACIGVRVERHVGDIDARFDRALDRIGDLERHNPRREGHARHLVVLAADARDHEVVQVTVPMWMARMALDAGLDSEMDGHGHGRDVRDRYRVDWRGARDLDELGPGLLVSVDDDGSRVLVWLE